MAVSPMWGGAQSMHNPRSLTDLKRVVSRVRQCSWGCQDSASSSTRQRNSTCWRSGADAVRRGNNTTSRSPRSHAFTENRRQRATWGMMRFMMRSFARPSRSIVMSNGCTPDLGSHSAEHQRSECTLVVKMRLLHTEGELIATSLQRRVIQETRRGKGSSSYGPGLLLAPIVKM